MTALWVQFVFLKVSCWPPRCTASCWCPWCCHGLKTCLCQAVVKSYLCTTTHYHIQQSLLRASWLIWVLRAIHRWTGQRVRQIWTLYKIIGLSRNNKFTPMDVIFFSKTGLWKALNETAASVPPARIRKQTQLTNDWFFEVINREGSSVGKK